MTNEELEKALVRLGVATFNELEFLHLLMTNSIEPEDFKRRRVEAFAQRFMTETGLRDLPGFAEEMQRQDPERRGMELLDQWERELKSKN